MQLAGQACHLAKMMHHMCACSIIHVVQNMPANAYLQMQIEKLVEAGRQQPEQRASSADCSHVIWLSEKPRLAAPIWQSLYSYCRASRLSREWLPCSKNTRTLKFLVIQQRPNHIISTLLHCFQTDRYLPVILAASQRAQSPMHRMAYLIVILSLQGPLQAVRVANQAKG